LRESERKGERQKEKEREKLKKETDTGIQRAIDNKGRYLTYIFLIFQLVNSDW
jgi:hypothetical protein